MSREEMYQDNQLYSMSLWGAGFLPNAEFVHLTLNDEPVPGSWRCEIQCLFLSKYIKFIFLSGGKDFNSYCANSVWFKILNFNER